MFLYIKKHRHLESVQTGKTLDMAQWEESGAGCWDIPFCFFFVLKKKDYYLLSTLNSMDLTSYQGWKKERIVQDFLDGSRIIIVMPDEKQCMKKVTI